MATMANMALDIPRPLLNALAVFGAANVAYLAYQTIPTIQWFTHRSTLKRYHHETHSVSKDKIKGQPWALVTGASDGIGAAFVSQLAARGFNVILHGRNQTKLDTFISSLQQEHPKIQFKSLILDATAQIDSTFDSTVLTCLSGLNLTAVIHNVGGPGTARLKMDYFQDYDGPTIDKWIDVNARFATHLTRVVLPILKQSQPALMFFISSAAAEFPAPFFSVYAGAKSYIEQFARCLRLEIEMEKQDIEVMALSVGTVATASSGRSQKDVSFTMPTAEEMARSSLDSVGMGKAVVMPYIGHAVQLGIFGLLPDRVRDRMVAKVSREMKATI